MRIRWRNFQLDSWHPTRAFLFLNLVTATLTVLSAGVVSAHRPIGPYWLGILVATLIGGLFFAIPLRTLRVGYRVGAVMAIGMGAVLYRLWPAISLRAAITASGDVSNYVAFAQYLFRYVRGTAGNLPPIDQYVSYFSDTRFAIASVLSVFSSFYSGDPALALGPLIALLLINAFGGFTALAHQLSCSTPLSLLVGISALLLGWIPNMIYVGSLDNLFFLALFPFILVRLQLIFRGGTDMRSSFALGITIAAAIYAYPEGVLIAAAIFLPLLIALSARAWRRGEVLIRMGSAILVAMLLVIPYVHTFIAFVLHQFQVTSQLMTITDGVFPGLQTKEFTPAAFALGQEFPNLTCDWPDISITLFLVAFSVVGLLRWWRRNPPYCWSFGCFLVVVLLQGVQPHHSYAIYKLLTIGSVLAIPLIFAGIAEIYSRFLRGAGQLAPVALGCLLVLVTAWRVSHNAQFTPKRVLTRLEPYRELRQLTNVTHGESLSLLCDNYFDYKWALIYLRDQPQAQKLEWIGLLFPWFRPLMTHAKESIPATYTLVNRNVPEAVWKNDKFSLVAVSDTFAPIVAVDAPNGIETVDGANFVWLSNKASSFLVDSPKEGQAILWARKVRCGPSRPNDTVRTVVVQTETGIYEQRVEDAFSISLNLKKGVNSLQLRCRELPTLTVLPNGDRRTLLLGLEDYQIKLVPGR